MLISELVNFGNKNKDQVDSNKFTEMACYMLESLVKFENNEHPLGSWKDMKYFMNYYTNYNCEKYMNPKVLKDICPGVFGVIKPVGYCMIGTK